LILTEMFARLTLVRALVMGLFLAGLYYVTMYDNGEAQRAMIQQSQSTIQRLQGELAQVEESLQRAKSFQSASLDLGNSIQKLLSFIPEDFRMGQLMKMISQEARIAGLDLKNMQPVVVVQGTNNFGKNLTEFEEIGVQLELRGTFTQILSFMSSLTEKKQIFLFEKIKIFKTLGVQGEEELVTLTAEVHAYSYLGASKTASGGLTQ